VATTDETAPAADDEHAAARSRKFWNLNVDDQRVMYITVVGGLAANVGLVLVIALGFLEVHLIHRYRHEPGIISEEILVQASCASLRERGFCCPETYVPLAAGASPLAFRPWWWRS
jgi:hypothetical protein